AERSGGGQGWHVWLFFGTPLPAEQARRLALQLVPNDLQLADGAPADPRRTRGVEVFPKTTGATGGLGTMVWLPYWSSARPGCDLFYDVPAEGAPQPVAVVDFVRAPAARIDEALAAGQGPAATAPDVAAAEVDEPEGEPDFRARAAGFSVEVSREW